MSEDHYGILQDAPKTPSPICCCGLFNKGQLKYFAVFWAVGLLVIAAMFVLPYLQYKMLPKPMSSSSAGLLQFSEERYVMRLPFYLRIGFVMQNECGFRQGVAME